MRKTILLAHPGCYTFARKLIRTMRLTSSLLLLLCIQVPAMAFAQGKISVSSRNISVKQLLKDIETQSGYRFVYNNLLLQEDQTLDIEAKNATLDVVMQQILKDRGLSYTLKENNLVVIYKAAHQEQQDINVSGRVTDSKGLPLPGVSVKASGAQRGTSTNSEGRFSLVVPKGTTALEFSFVGFATRVIAIKGRTEIDVSLTEDNRTLEEVTVTGYTNYSRSQSANAASVVTSQKIAQVPMASVDQVLQGRVPGMTVMSESGQPGSAAAVTIRGVGSINGSTAPLYVMDGIPIESSYFQTINPEDIESVTVLKDASAKALYGSRGSNGVIVITTKKGSTGQLSVEYKSQYGISDLTRPGFTMMNTEQRLRFEEEVGLEMDEDIGPGWTFSPRNPANANLSQEEKNRNEYILDSIGKINTNWRDIFFQQSKFMEQQLSVSGGNENLRFYNSLNYYSQDGIAKRTGMDRYALRSNVDFRSGKFSGNVNLSLGYSNSSFTEGEGTTRVGTAMASVYYALPYEYPYAPDGTLIHPGNEDEYDNIYDLREGSQGLERLLNSSNKTDQLKTVTGISLNYEILPGFRVSTRAGVDYRNSTDQVYINPDSYYGSRDNSTTVGGKGRFEEGTRRNFNIISTSGISYAKNISNLHDFEVSGFFEYVHDHYRAFNYVGFGLDERLPETPASITNNSPEFFPTVGGGRTQSALLSYMATGRYTYNRKYTFTGSYRYDGSTKVARKNRWHGFYSLGGNWNVKEESFLKDVSAIRAFTIRASYGTTASPFSGDFLYLATYLTGQPYGSAQAIYASTPGNNDFDWEYVDEFNAGFDLRLLKDSRLRVSADFYNRITRNMFIDQPLSATSGFDILSLSSGRMRNRGIEFDVQGDIIKREGFSWTVGINGSYNKNTILHLTDITDEILDGDARILKVGKAYGSYYAPRWAGVNKETGEPQYYTKEGTVTSTYNENTQSVAESGSMFPAFTGGISTGANWKGFSASVLFSFVSDVMRWNNEDYYNENMNYMTSNQSVRMLENRWKKPGDDAILQRIDIPRKFTSKDIQDASFLRLRNVTLGYSLSKPAVEKLGLIKGARIFLQAQNLFTWTKWRGLDPENSSQFGRFQYPAARTYTAGLNVNF